MSVRVMKIVWDASVSPSTRKLVLLALADWANDEGGSLHPSLQAVAVKVGLSRRQVQRIVQGFIDEGLLSVIANRFGGAHGCTPHYRLHLDRIKQLRRTDRSEATPTDDTSDTPTGVADDTRTDDMDDTGDTDDIGDTGDADGCHGRRGRVSPVTRTGDTHVTQTIINHQRTIKEPPEKSAREAFAPAVSSVKGSRICPPDFTVTAEMRHWACVEAPTVNLETETARFMARGVKRATSDWVGAWKIWMGHQEYLNASFNRQARARAYRERKATPDVLGIGSGNVIDAGSRFLLGGPSEE